MLQDFMKPLLIIFAFILGASFYSKANTDCIYIASKSGITIRVTSQCTVEYQSFLDSFVNRLALKINRNDTSYHIFVLVNSEFLYYDFSGSPDYFTSIGVDTLREINTDYIIRYCYKEYGSTNQSRLAPLDINATDEKKATKEVGVKIIYNIDQSKNIDWTEVEKLISFSTLNFDRIRSSQNVDTVRHYAWYVMLPTLDTATINLIIG